MLRRQLFLLIFLAVFAHPTSLARPRNYSGGRKTTSFYIRKYGYPAEEHEVKTSDGYYLTLFRIPYGRENPSRFGRVPILIQHGIIMFSDSFVLRGPQDLVFQLAERGYDVWIGNTRGTPYSRHQNYTQKDFKFWDFSIDEIAGRDLPAMVDHVLAVTRQPSLTYIGHSRGCIMPVMLLSSQPQYRDKIHVLFLISPVIYSTRARSPLYELAGDRPFSLMRLTTFEKMVAQAKLAKALQFPDSIQNVLKRVCSTGTMLDRICPAIYFFINGVDYDNVDYKIVPDLVHNLFGGMSMKELIHVLQLGQSGKVQMYDYRDKNLQVYGRAHPPEYDIAKTTPPTYIYHASNDLFIDDKNLRKFMKQLPNLMKDYKVPDEKFNHLDYIIGLNTDKVFIPQFLEDVDDFHNHRRLISYKKAF